MICEWQKLGFIYENFKFKLLIQILLSFESPPQSKFWLQVHKNMLRVPEYSCLLLTEYLTFTINKRRKNVLQNILFLNYLCPPTEKLSLALWWHFWAILVKMRLIIAGELSGWTCFVFIIQVARASLKAFEIGAGGYDFVFLTRDRFETRLFFCTLTAHSLRTGAFIWANRISTDSLYDLKIKILFSA